VHVAWKDYDMVVLDFICILYEALFSSGCCVQFLASFAHYDGLTFCCYFAEEEVFFLCVATELNPLLTKGTYERVYSLVFLPPATTLPGSCITHPLSLPR